MLTKRQKQILDFINEKLSKKGIAPTLEEIARHFRLASLATVHEHLQALQKKGYLNRQPRQARAMEPKKTSRGLIEIPIRGTIAAGQPIEAIEAIDETITLPKYEISTPSHHYALRVQGNSMINEGIFDGDIVVIKEQKTADDGQTVVAIIDENEATLKKLYREKGRVRLQPANQIMLPIYRKNVEIRGVVEKIIRNLDNNTQNSFVHRKKAFLDRIKSQNGDSQNKYKRVVESPIRYAGGKS